MSPAAPLDARRRSFLRKVIYLAAMGGLLMPLFWLSHPATRPAQGEKGRAAGKLAELRQQYRLGQTELGEIHPSSETIKLVSLGMRGIAGSILWQKANQFQMKKDFTNLRATLDQISELQPHSISVWRYQAWNLSFNVSVAFDDFRDKYYWIIEGIKFVQRGAALNDHEPRLLWDVGWFISQKIGKADDAKLFRRLFVHDDEFHGARSPALRDNWLVGKEWYREAEERIDQRHPVRGMAEAVFYASAPLNQFYYAEALEKDGHFQEVAARAWKQSSVDWHEMGQRELKTGERTFRLNDLEKHQAVIERAIERIEQLSPGLREKLEQGKRDRLSAAERKALHTPLDKRTPAQAGLVAEAQSKLLVTWDEVARRVTPEPKREEAVKLAKEIAAAEDQSALLRSERSIVNFDGWKLRAEMEQSRDAVEAREAIYQAERAYEQGDLLAARAAYERGLKGWRKLLDRFPAMKEDINIGEDLVEVIGHYAKCLDKVNEALPQKFFLQDVLDRWGKRR